MKPTFQLNDSSRQRDTIAARRKGFTSPKVDFNFQPADANYFGRGKGKDLPSFRGISSDYFKNEARGHFAIEALVFGVIGIIAAVPVIEGIRGLAQFVYGVL